MQMYKDDMDPWAAKIWEKRLQEFYSNGQLTPEDYDMLKKFLEVAKTAWSEREVSAEVYLSTRPNIVKPFAKLLGLRVEPPLGTSGRSGSSGSLVVSTGRGANVSLSKPHPTQMGKQQGSSPRPKSPAVLPPGTGGSMPTRKPIPNTHRGMRSTSTSTPDRPSPASKSDPIATAAGAGMRYGKGALPPRTTIPRPEAAPWAPRSKPPEWMEYAQTVHTARQSEQHVQGEPQGHHGKSRLPGHANQPVQAATKMAGQRRPHIPLPQSKVPGPKIAPTGRLMRFARQGMKWWK